MSKNIEIQIEVEREFVIETDRRGTITSSFCIQCGGVEDMFFVDEAALATRSNSRSIFNLVETGALHSMENANGLLLVCKRSLSQAAVTQTNHDI